MSTVLPGVAGPVGTANVSSPTPSSGSDAARAEPAAKPVTTQPVQPANPAGRPSETRAAAEQPRDTSRPISQSTTPALSTYQDQSSGRLVVKVFDRTSGQVLAEFPPEKSLQFYPQHKSTALGVPQPSVEVEA